MTPINEIISAVAFYWHVDERDIRGRSRLYSFVRARHCVCWIARHLGMRCEEVGRLMELDHSTVIHATQRVQREARMVGHCLQILADIMSSRPCVDEVLLMCE